MSPSRDAILRALAKCHAPGPPIADFALPEGAADTHAQFVLKARASAAKLHDIASEDDAPEALWAILNASGLPPLLHVPASSPLRALPWHRAPGLALSAEPPSGEDAAFSAADYAIAETGTLVCFSGPRSPSSWHFRPGREFLLLRRGAILPRFEDAIALLEGRDLPATINLITGPSRTADIEQTIELGAHGPRETHILICR
jgi:L-lactate dehydrogenase complex protein LldG